MRKFKFLSIIVLTLILNSCFYLFSDYDAYVRDDILEDGKYDGGAYRKVDISIINPDSIEARYQLKKFYGIKTLETDPLIDKENNVFSITKVMPIQLQLAPVKAFYGRGSIYGGSSRSVYFVNSKEKTLQCDSDNLSIDHFGTNAPYLIRSGLIKKNIKAEDMVYFSLAEDNFVLKEYAANIFERKEAIFNYNKDTINKLNRDILYAYKTLKKLCVNLPEELTTVFTDKNSELFSFYKIPAEFLTKKKIGKDEFIWLISKKYAKQNQSQKLFYYYKTNKGSFHHHLKEALAQFFLDQNIAHETEIKFLNYQGKRGREYMKVTKQDLYLKDIYDDKANEQYGQLSTISDKALPVWSKPKFLLNFDEDFEIDVESNRSSRHWIESKVTHKIKSDDKVFTIYELYADDKIITDLFSKRSHVRIELGGFDKSSKTGLRLVGGSGCELAHWNLSRSDISKVKHQNKDVEGRYRKYLEENKSSYIKKNYAAYCIIAAKDHYPYEGYISFKLPKREYAEIYVEFFLPNIFLPKKLKASYKLEVR